MRKILHKTKIISALWFFAFGSAIKEGFPGGASGKEPSYQCRRYRDASLIPGWEGPLEKETGNYSSILSWEIPWTEELGRLQSKGLQMVRRDLGTKPSPPPPYTQK